MIDKRMIVLVLIATLAAQAAIFAQAQIERPGPERKKSAKQNPPFAWVNPLKRIDLPGVKHATFRSPSMNVEVGYCIYLPPGYEAAENAQRRYPVVYYLHGGRPGSETKSVSLAKYVHEAIEAGKVPPMIYVFVNGGRVSHYNTPDLGSMGEEVFIKELIPHIDATYRTIAERGGRALDGFSQGGRGTARIIFRHPDVFCSASPGGGGMATEKRIAENNGAESETLKFAPGYDTWTLAREYAAKGQPHKPRLLVYVGTKDFNYESNLEWMKHLESLQIPFERLIGEGIPHSGNQWYDQHGEQIMRFHTESFRRSGKLSGGS